MSLRRRQRIRSDHVVGGTAEELVVAFVAVDGVLGHLAGREAGGEAQEERLAGVAEDEVAPRAAVQAVVALPAANQIVAA